MPTTNPAAAHQTLDPLQSAPPDHAAAPWPSRSLRSLAVSNNDPCAVCEQPDSGKVGVLASAADTRLRKVFRAETDIDDCDRESLQPPP